MYAVPRLSGYKSEAGPNRTKDPPMIFKTPKARENIKTFSAYKSQSFSWSPNPSWTLLKNGLKKQHPTS
ncbi:hypothetical protein E5288_WYG003678 [Bos mutus]|uniref:Uncharacterized protein n=1 Tax=Bos mutus TaxID=72004 RepID=A0A6B0RUC5_9CETA|nr:hypothetical protein [Bos mutus]